MPTSFAARPRLFEFVGMALAAPAAVLVLLAAINRFDEPLSPDAQAWLNYQAPHAPERSSGYLAFQPDYGLAKSQSLMQLARAEDALHAKDPQTAYREWAGQQRIWQKAAAEAMTVDGLQQAAVQLEYSQMILAGMLKRHPESIDAARQHALPVLQSQVALEPLFSRVLVRQFQLAAQAIAGKTESGADVDGVIERLYLYFYQRNASLNLANRMFRDYMAQNGIALDGKVPMAAPAQTACKPEKNWLALANQYGRHLICMARLDYSAQRKRMVTVDAGVDGLKLTLATQQ